MSADRALFNSGPPAADKRHRGDCVASEAACIPDGEASVMISKLVTEAVGRPASVRGRRGRSYERIEISDLEGLGRIAAEDRERFYRKRPEYRDRLICVALCQGAGKHFVDMELGSSNPNGVKDLDVWSFFAAIPGERFPADRRNVGVDYGPSKFGRQEPDQIAPQFRRFVGRNVDLLMRALPVPVDAEPASALQDYLSEARTKSAQELAAKGVVLIEPAVGTIVWPSMEELS